MRSHTLLPILLILLSLASLLPSTSLACPTCPTPKPPPPPKAKPCPPPPPKSKPPPTPPSPKPKPPSPSPPKPSGCPIDVLKLDACVDVLGGLVHALLGGSADRECCPVISGLAGLDAALCLCTAIRVKLLNINVLLPVALEVLVDCGKHVPSDFECPA